MNHPSPVLADLTFRGGEFTAASLNEAEPSVEIDNANVNFNNSVLKSSHAQVGTTRTTRLGFSAGQWVSQGRVEIGKTGEGFLSVLAGSLVKSAESRIGNRAAGAVSNGFAGIEIRNLAPGFQFDLKTNGPAISLAALNDGGFAPPLQGQIASSNVITLGSISYLPFSLTVTDNCSIVETIGPVTRSGKELFQILGTRRDSDCRGLSAKVSHILPLGHLNPGTYQFHFMSDGVVVYTAQLEMPADSSELLTVTRSAGGDVVLQVNGLPGAPYIVQASLDLRQWFDLPSHLGTFLGPYSLLEPADTQKAKFYRVKTVR